jgi:hypothetical protein
LILSSSAPLAAGPFQKRDGHPQQGVNQAIEALAPAGRCWHERAMNPGSKVRLGGGCLLSLSILVGVIGGTLLRQPSIGFLAGLGAGILLLALVWLLNRR